MLMAADEFFDWIERQSKPHDLVDGIPVRMMAGAKQSHNVVTSNIVVALAPSARTKGCRTISSGMAVRTGRYGLRYPDVVVEVISPGAPIIDWIDRVDEYQARDDI